MKSTFWIVLLVSLALVLWSCSKDEGDDTPAPQPQADNASGSVNSDTSAVITTTGGARMNIPIGAVPRTSSGARGTMVFSIERDNNMTPQAPSGETQCTEVYRFGPEGFVMAAPVEIAIPVRGDQDPGNVAIYRINPTTNAVEYYGGEYDAATRTVRAQTYELSPWFGAQAPGRDTAWGCLNVSNGSGRWVRICVDQYTLTYPAQDSVSMPDLGVGSTWAPQGTIGWANTGHMYLPQGTYRLCVQYQHETDRYSYTHAFREDIQITHAWNRLTSPDGLSFGIGTPIDTQPGECNCTPRPTPSVGTGAIQTTLTWYEPSPGVDLDLHVVDPSGEEIFYAHRNSESGGELDIDNICGDWSHGVSENIYWTQSPPVGEYIVKVHYFGDCNEDNAVETYYIRTVVQGDARTFNGSINADETKEITRFSIHAGSVVYLPGEPHTSTVTQPYPPKNVQASTSR